MPIFPFSLYGSMRWPSSAPKAGGGRARFAVGAAERRAARDANCRTIAIASRRELDAISSTPAAMHAVTEELTLGAISEGAARRFGSKPFLVPWSSRTRNLPPVSFEAFAERVRTARPLKVAKVK